MAGTDRAAVQRAAFGTPLVAYLALLTLANLWTAYRVGDRIRDSVVHGTFFRAGGEVYWTYPTTIPLLILAGAAGLALLGLLGLWLRFIAGLWVFWAAQLAALAVPILYRGAVVPALAGLVGAGLLTVLVLQRRAAFR